MALHDDFLSQARDLTGLDDYRPRYINLRRAISSAYYAVFHRIVADAVARWIGSMPAAPREPNNPDEIRYDWEVARWFHHTRMKRVSMWYRNPPRSVASAPRPVKRLLLSGKDVRFSSDLEELADAFVVLQEKRHVADYDLSYKPSRLEAIHTVERAKDAFQRCDQLQDAAAYRLYLMLLLDEGGRATDRT